MADLEPPPAQSTSAPAASGPAAGANLECWRGALPAVFTLAPDEVCGIHTPRPFHKCLPRQSLLPFVCEAVRAHFAPFGPPMGGEMWFEHAGTPLRWQLPIGVLFDLLVGAAARTDDDDALPWRITVRFTSFPSATLLRATPKEAESVLLNALKESCYLRCGSALPAMSLSPGDQQKLAAALASSTDESYADGYAPIAATLAEAVRLQLQRQPPRAVPLRVFTSPTAWRQQPVPPCQPDGSPSTLRHALAMLLPHFFGVPHELGGARDAGAGGAAGGGTEGTEGTEGTGGEGSVARAADGGDHKARAIVQGVDVPLEASLTFLADACSHPDGWLYVSVAVGAT